MFNLFKKNQPQPEMRDLLFGDTPVGRWPSEARTPEPEPWLSFIKAREAMAAGKRHEAIGLYHGILGTTGVESRQHLQAWHFLRGLGIQPDAAIAKQLLGVVVEVGIAKGLDIVAAYADRTARYFNFSGAAVIWDAPDDSVREEIEDLLQAGEVVVRAIGPWEGQRPSAPPAGQARISMLTPTGLHFGQAPLEALSADPMGGPVIAAATRLMQALMAKSGV